MLSANGNKFSTHRKFPQRFLLSKIGNKFYPYIRRRRSQDGMSSKFVMDLSDKEIEVKVDGFRPFTTGSSTVYIFCHHTQYHGSMSDLHEK